MILEGDDLGPLPYATSVSCSKFAWQFMFYQGLEADKPSGPSAYGIALKPSRDTELVSVESATCKCRLPRVESSHF